VTRVHVFTAVHHDATRFNLGEPVGEEHWVEWSARKLIRTDCCNRLRWAKNCTVQVYYDGCRFWCRDGKGCKRGGCPRCDKWRTRAFDGLPYLAWHEKADRWRKRGIPHRYCRSCKRYSFVRRSAR
jgi:hypothetical protein